MIYAKISNGSVVNIIELNHAQEEEFPDCVPLNNVPAAIGDRYEDGVFYRDGEKVKTISALLAEAEEAMRIILTGESE